MWRQKMIHQPQLCRFSSDWFMADLPSIIQRAEDVSVLSAARCPVGPFIYFFAVKERDL